jgi:hypothetical protein
MHEVIFTSPADTAGISLEWCAERPSSMDPRLGGEMPPFARPPLLDVTEIAFAGLVVADPQRDAQRLSELFDLPITFVDPDAAPGRPVAGVSVRDCTVALFPIPPSEDESRRLWAWHYTRPLASSLGVKVPDLAAAVDALGSANVPILRHDDDLVVLGPGVTGGVTLVVTDHLLPGDPRSDAG